MRMVENKITFYFSKEDVKTLKRLIELAKDEDFDTYDIGCLFTDIISPEKERIFDLSNGFDTFNIEVEN